MTDVVGERSLHGRLLIVRRIRGLQLIETEEPTRHRTATVPMEITTAAAAVEVAAADVAAKEDVDRGEDVTPLRTAVMTETG